MSVKVDDFKALERHPLSAEYRNLNAKAKKAMGANMREHGFLPDKPVVLHEGMVLDGWQRHTVALENDIEPVYRNLPDGWTPEAYVESANDSRRHESPEIMEARAKERRERIKARLKEGESQRKIAEEEGVSQATISKDAATLAAGGEDVQPETGKTVGTDGRTYTTATKGWCKRCLRMGVQTKGCKSCKKARATKKAAKKLKPAPKKNGQMTYDFRPFNDGYGILMREIDKAGKHYGMKDSAEAEACRTLLIGYKTKFNATVNGWKSQRAVEAKATKETAKA